LDVSDSQDDSEGNTVYCVTFLDEIQEGMIHRFLAAMFQEIPGLGYAFGHGSHELLVWANGKDEKGQLLLRLTALLNPRPAPSVGESNEDTTTTNQ
jgi:hypothetical protein